MLNVKTPDEVLEIIKNNFSAVQSKSELVLLGKSLGRILAENVIAEEYVPDFDRSTVDGYALRGEDTFGCSESIPAVLDMTGCVDMGSTPSMKIKARECAYVPTGGALPEGADAVAMLEYAENYGREIGIKKPAAPGENVIYRGDDVFPGKTVLKAGRRLTIADIGALAALGKTSVSVRQKPIVGIISTGDELVDISKTPAMGKVRDVNSAMLCAAVEAFGGNAKAYGIVRDGFDILSAAVEKAVSECDAILISGGSSVGVMDSTSKVIETRGQLLLHGIAIKPGKPTIMGKIDGKPVVGLPGHPVAAYFVTEVFVRPIVDAILGCQTQRPSFTARLSEPVAANHGRTAYVAVNLEERDSALWAVPVRTKSGLITNLAGADGYFSISHECEGLPEGAELTVYAGQSC